MNAVRRRRGPGPGRRATNGRATGGGSHCGRSRAGEAATRREIAAEPGAGRARILATNGRAAARASAAG